MFIEPQEPECSACGAADSEMFYYKQVQGRRCRCCGHEHIMNDFRPKEQKDESWPTSATHTRPTF